MLQVSAALAEEVHLNQHLQQASAWGPMEFDRNGNLLPFDG
jgi:hypothetical protein